MREASRDKENSHTPLGPSAIKKSPLKTPFAQSSQNSRQSIAGAQSVKSSIASPRLALN